MIEGLDTTFLVQAELSEHPGHGSARALLTRLLDRSARLAIAPQVLAEFVHLVTDPRRFERPLSMGQAVSRAACWWQAREVLQVVPSDESVQLFLRWMSHFGLGRKRVLDTLLAATYFSSGIQTLITTNARDYRVFGCFTLLTPE